MLEAMASPLTRRLRADGVVSQAHRGRQADLPGEGATVPADDAAGPGPRRPASRDVASVPAAAGGSLHPSPVRQRESVPSPNGIRRPTPPGTRLSTATRTPVKAGILERLSRPSDSPRLRSFP